LIQKEEKIKENRKRITSSCCSTKRTELFYYLIIYAIAKTRFLNTQAPLVVSSPLSSCPCPSYSIDELLYREEMMWLQRSRITWLKEGDRNTKLFHRKAVWRAKKNRIKKLKQDEGNWCTNQQECSRWRWLIFPTCSCKTRTSTRKVLLTFLMNASLLL